ncbi:MAG TPA: NADPH-dependent glutamate synthase [Anaerolineae bacterium]|nr:NADPH-dependent glutamate synthase [Anaerolineae bacterium]HNT05623.1 NADPH-dependent glutamate synthase [Anaerolineae bacterium]
MAKVAPRNEMPRQDPHVRGRNFDEVALGYSAEQALAEAQRCLQCKNPTCRDGCPVNVRIPEFILALRDNDMWRAVEMLKDKNNLPAICGRVCPQETQCEEKCVLGKKFEPVAIGRLERYVADWEIGQGVRKPTVAPPTGKKVAVIGAGPAGLTCAGDLAKLGHQVVIYESLHAPGGVLIYGIPEFRLPKAIVRTEVQYVQSLGAELRLNSVIGKLATVDELFAQGYDAIFLGTGAGLPMFMNIPGENLNGVYSANEFLTRTNLMKAYKFPEYDTPIMIGKQVAVIGAGNVAMDSARCALRLGADRVQVVYRRTKAEAPARAEELENAEEEGIEFHYLTNPVSILGTDKGWVSGIRLQKQQLGEPDASGRPRPVPIPGSEYEEQVDMVIMALGTRPNPMVFTDTPSLERTKHGTVVANEESGRTKRERIWSGGDIVTGAATVISAMGAGKRAAADIDAYLKNPQQTWWVE